MGTNPNLKSSMELMEGPIGAKVVPIIAPNVFHVVVLRALPPIVALGVQPKKHAGGKTHVGSWRYQCR